VFVRPVQVPDLRRGLAGEAWAALLQRIRNDPGADWNVATAHRQTTAPGFAGTGKKGRQFDCFHGHPFCHRPFFFRRTA
jgi:hypothetical protein